MWEVVKELRQLMKDIPMYSSHFMSVLNEVLMGYRDSLRLLYKGCLLCFSLSSLLIRSSDIVWFCVVAELTSGPSEGGGPGGKAGSGAVGAWHHEHIISSKWAKDDDIKRMIM